MYFTPIGVFCTIVPVVEANGTETIISLATQLIILYLAFFIFAFVVYGLAVKVIGKESPVRFFKVIMPAALNAFGTCSSSATIPISKQCMEEGMGVSNKITSIAIPLGATVNMDAVSILMSFMIMFFANACGINVSVSMMVIVLLANVLLSLIHIYAVSASLLCNAKGAYPFPEYAPTHFHLCYGKFCNYFIESLALSVASYCQFPCKIHAQNT